MFKSGKAAICVALAALTTGSLFAQAKQPKEPPSRIDLFAGYSYWQPRGFYNGIPFDPNYAGMIFSGAYYQNRWSGLEIEGERHGQTKNNGMRSISMGPILRFSPGDGSSLFGHLLVGAADLMGPNVPTIGTTTFAYNPDGLGVILTAGGGADITTSLFHHRLGFRLVQVDYQYLHVDRMIDPTENSRLNLSAVRFSTGLIYHIGQIKDALPLSYSCAASPDEVFAGDPVAVTGTATNLNPKHSAVYSWAGSDGAQPEGSDSVANVDTSKLAPGTYTIRGHVSDGKDASAQADCSASFTVKRIEPPTVSCVANPMTLHPGDTATISADGISPQNRTLTYSYSASAGTIRGSGNSATLNTAGAPTGAIEVTCKVEDDKGQNATANTTVDVEAAPAPPAVPKTQSLCSLNFNNDKLRPARVNNEAKACLDDVALNAQQQPDASIVLVGNAAPAKRGRHHRLQADLGAQRAVNAKAYLVKEKGVDPSRVQVRAGSSGENEVQTYLVPAGGKFDSDSHGASPVDESMVKPQSRHARHREGHTQKAAH